MGQTHAVPPELMGVRSHEMPDLCTAAGVVHRFWRTGLTGLVGFRLVLMRILASLATLLSVVLATGSLLPAPLLSPPATLAPVPYQVPVSEPASVLTPFRPPPTPYSAGHRGVDLAAESGAPVLGAAAGLVSFAGSVAGRGVIVLQHPDGLSTEYEPVSTTVTAGQLVRAGQRIGRVQGQHVACAPASCLHWGARRGGHYLDPMSLLARLGVVRLLPWLP
jgi:murein DD-endopeptidase MepM/ murein hydrolase activator NlpD